MAQARRRVDKEIRLKAGEFVLLDVVEDDRTIRVRIVAPRSGDGQPDTGSPAPRKSTPNTRAAAPAKRATGSNVAAKRSTARNVATKKAAPKRG
jgi:hypothetical protein